MFEAIIAMLYCIANGYSNMFIAYAQQTEGRLYASALVKRVYKRVSHVLKSELCKRCLVTSEIQSSIKTSKHYNGMHITIISLQP